MAARGASDGYAEMKEKYSTLVDRSAVPSSACAVQETKGGLVHSGRWIRTWSIIIFHHSPGVDELEGLPRQLGVLGNLVPQLA